MNKVATATGLKSLLFDPMLNESKLAAFLYSDHRAKGIVKHHIAKKNFNFSDVDEAFQRSIFAFFEESKKQTGRLLDRMGSDVEGFYRLWWRVAEIVVLDLMREFHRHEHFKDDDQEEAAIQRASLLDDCAAQRFEDKIESQMVYDHFNEIFDNKSSAKIKSIMDKAMKTPKSKARRGRPIGSSKKMIPLVSGVIVDAPTVYAVNKKHDAKGKAARLSAIRKALGASIEDYAIKLDIPEYRLVSYLYARVQKIPDQVVSDAEALFQRENNVVAAKVAVDGMEMPDILVGWRKKIKGTNEHLEQLLGVSTSTMERWEAGKTRPSIRRLRQYNQTIEGAAWLLRKKSKKQTA